MAGWKNANEIEALYLVSAERLLAFAARGNLPLCRADGGEVLFDESAVARLFRARSGGMTVSTQAAARPGFGVLGATRLGQPAQSGPRSSARDLRARALRMGREIVEQAQKKAAG